MRKLVICGSVSLKNEIKKWVNYFEKNNFKVIAYPKTIEEDKFTQVYPEVHKSFLENITKCDVLFIMNEDKNGCKGYIGAETFAELCFGLAQNLIYNKNIELIIYKMPDEKVACYDEIKLWLELGWIKIHS